LTKSIYIYYGPLIKQFSTLAGSHTCRGGDLMARPWWKGWNRPLGVRGLVVRLAWSRRRPDGFESGAHLVLVVYDGDDTVTWYHLNDGEVEKLGSIAFLLMRKHGGEQKRGRVLGNNAGEQRRDWVHVHLSFPAPDSAKMPAYVTEEQGEEPDD